MASKYYRAMQILKINKARWLKLNPNIPEETGIYILTREDECGMKYAYIGQTKAKGGILERLAQHLYEYPPQHIDLSLKKHKLYDPIKNPYGWRVECCKCSEEELDNLEKLYILQYASKGYQLRNKTSGSQGKGKIGINENKPNKGYRDGLKQGYKNAIRDVREFFEKYLNVITKHDPECYKKNGELKKIYIDKLQEFEELLNNERAEDNDAMDQESN